MFITVVSSYTVDVIPQDDGGAYREVPGGPALYITEALTRLGCPHQVITGREVRVEVVPTPHGEEYVIPAVPPIELPNALQGDAVILSPVIREIDPAAVPEVEGLLVVDLQGFVRRPNQQSGHVSDLFELAGLLERAAVVKGSAGEIERLSDASRAAAGSSTLVVTQGSRGAVVETPAGRWQIPARPVAAPNTIGAGDTFLAGFVSFLLDGAAPQEAARSAARLTESLLRERLPTG